MGKKSSLTFSEQLLKDKGFIQQPDGTWMASKTVRTETMGYSQECIIPKLKVNDSPQFSAKPTTEWFIAGYSVPSKKNSRINFARNGKQVSIPSKKHAEYVKMTKMQYDVFGREFKKTVEELKLEYPLRIEFTFVRSTKHSFDYCNACQTVEDIMKGHWIPDDSADYIIPVFKPYEFDKNNPGVKIKLLTNKQ